MLRVIKKKIFFFCVKWKRIQGPVQIKSNFCPVTVSATAKLCIRDKKGFEGLLCLHHSAENRKRSYGAFAWCRNQKKEFRHWENSRECHLKWEWRQT